MTDKTALAHITLFKKNGGVLSKRITADPETGAPVSDGSACIMGAGLAKLQRVNWSSPTEVVLRYV
ncbi:hypothetical protein [Falsiruegeria mediterranea]|uniref:Uncharacterized protein n=1 Tax=Falsiruegeria mediterranea M17 TaxID=1200281 RepID=A0A2R8C8A1_9RHOB|nr:hypothetical protein [Falsiruegeria mediterranea]SPJ28661.1 hypothetical protein TRM7615_02164 [Falsiruegeria mediterranea M17]